MDTASEGSLPEAATEADKAATIAAADTFSPAGAPVQTVPDVDPTHPAVDANPRAHTSIGNNAIQFNDPTISGPEQVAANMAGQKFEVQPETSSTPAPSQG